MSKEFRITTRRGHYRVEGKTPLGQWMEEPSSSFNGKHALAYAKERVKELMRRDEPWEEVVE